MERAPRILIITQKVDAGDSYFGFFPQWIDAFSQSCEKVTVITLELGTYDPPPNVTIHSLGKERHVSRLGYLLRFWKYAYAYRAEYDAVFCHMSPLYVITGWPIWKLFGKRIGLWYVHRSVDLKLRIAERLSDIIFTASPESFRIPSSKLHFMRQAVPVSEFAPTSPNGKHSNTLHLVSVGRITRIKNLDVLIRAAARLKEMGQEVEVELIGAPVTSFDEGYAAELKALAQSLGLEDVVRFTGSQPFAKIREAYWRADASVNLAPTGGMDKAVLESLAAGTPAFVANTAFTELLKGYEDRFLVPEGDSDMLAERLRSFAMADDREPVSATLRARISAEYSLDALIPAILTIFSTYESRH